MLEKNGITGQASFTINNENNAQAKKFCQVRILCKRNRFVGVCTQCNKSLCGTYTALIYNVSAKSALNSKVELYRHFQLYSSSKEIFMRVIMSVNILQKIKLQDRRLLA